MELNSLIISNSSSWWNSQLNCLQISRFLILGCDWLLAWKVMNILTLKYNLNFNNPLLYYNTIRFIRNTFEYLMGFKLTARVKSLYSKEQFSNAGFGVVQFMVLFAVLYVYIWILVFLRDRSQKGVLFLSYYMVFVYSMTCKKIQ